MGRASPMEWTMSKMAMDALSKGWALGFGTRVGAVDPDFEAAMARETRTERKPEAPTSFEWVLLLFAIGPMTRPQH